MEREQAIDAAVASGAFFQEAWDECYTALQWEASADERCGDCGCCPCGIVGCDECPPGAAVAHDSGLFGYTPAMAHGVSRTHALVTQDIAKGRSRFGPSALAHEVKRIAHRRNRIAWRGWFARADFNAQPPMVKPSTGWEVW